VLKEAEHEGTERRQIRNANLEFHRSVLAFLHHGLGAKLVFGPGSLVSVHQHPGAQFFRLIELPWLSVVWSQLGRTFKRVRRTNRQIALNAVDAEVALTRTRPVEA